MPRGIPNKKPAETNGEQISKMEAMRRALAKMGTEAKTVDYQAFIKKEFGLEMTTEMITNYKSTLKHSGEKSTVTHSPKAATPALKTQATGGFSLGELEAVKALADKIGAEKVQQL